MTSPISTIDPTAVPAMADQLNAALAVQDAASPLKPLESCDRCPSLAISTFGFTLGVVALCGHHMRLNLDALLAKAPASFWIEPSQLWSVRGVNVGPSTSQATGDGLTDS